MFTGIVETLGTVKSRQGNRLVILPQLPLKVGESVAVNGVCLTVDLQVGRGVQFRLLPETVRISTLGKLRAGDWVNLERSIRAGTRLGGHLLLGHVDGVGRVMKRLSSKGSVTLEVEIPSALAPFLVPKGPIALNGVSLTLGTVPPARLAGSKPGRAGTVSRNFEVPGTVKRIRVHLVSHTLAVTTLGKKPVGGQVNIEVDLIAKYLRGML